MPAHIAPRGSDDSCCECNQWSDCECGGAACGLTCESKAYTATLCGEPEIADPSTPPRFYKRKTVTGEMEMIKVFAAGCTAVLEVSSTQQVNGAGAGTYLKATFRRVGDLKVEITFELRWVAATNFYAWGAGDQNGVVNWSTANYDATILVTVGSAYAGMPVPCVWGATVIGNLDAGEITQDSWDQERTYAAGLAESPPVCEAVDTDDSVRIVAGSPVTGPFGDPPPNAYADADVTTSKTQRRTEGNEVCVGPDHLGWYRKTTGEVIENLSLEDTEDAAEDRATAGLDWSGCAPPCECATLTAFRALRGAGASTFSGRRVRVKANGSSLIPESTYTAKIRFFRRAIGTVGPYLFFAEYVVAAFTGPAETTKSTDWVDVPNEAGWETVAGNCAFTLVE